MKLNSITILLGVSISIAVLGLSMLVMPLYKDLKLKSAVSLIEPDLDILLQRSVAFAKEHGYLPDAQQLDLNSLDLRYVYRIKNWASNPAYVNTAVGQTAYIQGFLNGRAIGLRLGTGGMFTCLMANKKVHLAATCFYQVKEM